MEADDDYRGGDDNYTSANIAVDGEEQPGDNRQKELSLTGKRS
ncbi:MAG: hypothetical protein QM820_37340 [Minicystis sp.]